ncbi:2Fe-2S iron-sulfur cluster-binding protein [Limnohabitans sp. Rim8]|uniref:2Fe-2S iron-sulfur cluster-binding protein n=1 Tax=Limnohabitans sp. Rim8 TaxID=1100718 RepID=UPI00262CD2E3|nr:2Fe-2S iron-sulfur cluster-binding protein [Limnohabitans sp. Rim8]
MSYQVHIAGSDVSFGCDPGVFILDAALKAGIQIPYACRKGACGNCAVRIESGQVQRFVTHPETSAAGDDLLCQCRPQSDLIIRPADWRQGQPNETKRLQVKVYRNTAVAPDVSMLHLRLPAGQRAKFKAGQYLDVLLPDGHRRSYSMANPPHESDVLQIHVRHVEGGRFSQMASGLTAGDMLEVEFPFGQVTISNDPNDPLLCVCGGTGFAPIKSLLDDMAKQKSARPVTLIWGSRDLAGLYLLPQIDKWKKSLPNFQFVAAIEMAVEPQDFEVFQGRVDQAITSKASSLAPKEVYCCGSSAMVTAVKKICLDTLQVEASQFHADEFVMNPLQCK